MKSILIALIFAPCMLMASCEYKCPPSSSACRIETPLVEYDGHLWKAIMLEHHPDCGCDEEREFEWPEYENTDYELGN